MLKKSSILLSSYGGFQHGHYGYPACSHPLGAPKTPRAATRSEPPQRTGPQSLQRRSFAQVRSDHDNLGSAPDLEWPETTSNNRVPTPYQIFKQKKGTPYSKRRFYELVKIYHPDKHCHDTHSHSPSGISHAVKLERYRLVIAANDILSDPVKRKTYDRYGTGWGDWSEIDTSNNTSTHGKGWHGWSPEDSPARNATWEDWERWYQRDSPARKKPRNFFSNGGFVVILLLCSALGGMGEISRARQYSGSFIEQLEAAHDKASKEIQQRKKESQEFQHRDARVQSFLKTRDPRGFGLNETEQENYIRKLLPEPEICKSGDIGAQAVKGN